jgi:hypothetical protein
MSVPLKLIAVAKFGKNVALEKAYQWVGRPRAEKSIFFALEHQPNV